MFDSSGEEINWNALEDAVRVDKILNLVVRRQISSQETSVSSISRSLMLSKASIDSSKSFESSSNRFPLTPC